MEFGKVSIVPELVIIQEKNSKDKKIHKLLGKIIFLKIGAQNLKLCCLNPMFSFVWTVWGVKKNKNLIQNFYCMINAFTYMKRIQPSHLD